MEKLPNDYPHDIADEKHDSIKYKKEAIKDPKHGATLRKLSSDETGHKKKLQEIVKSFHK